MPAADCNIFDPACTPPGSLQEVNVGPRFLEPLVHSALSSLFGWSHREFKFEPGVTFLSTWQQVVIGAAIYLTIVLGGRELMKNRQPFVLKWIFVLHNVILVAVSGILLGLMLEILVPMLSQHGLRWSVCEPGAYDSRLVPFYYANYLVKWWEFIDTFFLVLKKKPLGGLKLGGTRGFVIAAPDATRSPRPTFTDLAPIYRGASRLPPRRYHDSHLLADGRLHGCGKLIWVAGDTSPEPQVLNC